jgi:hypothetical protein
LADTDGDPATEPDPLWTSLIPAPNHPEIHFDPFHVTGATMRVLALLLDNQTPFTVSSPALPGVTVTYQSFSDAAVEVGFPASGAAFIFARLAKSGAGSVNTSRTRQ